MFAELTDVWARYFYDYPLDLALTAAVHLEPDASVRPGVRGQANHHYVAVLRLLVADLVTSGRLRPELDVDSLVTLLVVTYTHLALAPHVEGLDPLLPMGDVDAACAAGRTLVGMLVDQFAVRDPA